jgi:sirohydrochlorin ferrochelatase
VTLKRSADLGQTTLLLAAHGSSRPGGQNPVQVLAKSLKARNLFADVLCGFLKQPPLLSQILPQLIAPKLCVIPMLTGHGYITDELIPEALLTLSDSTIVNLCQPIGTTTAVQDIMAERARSMINDKSLEPDKISILVAAHGNKKNSKNAEQTHLLADHIERMLGIATTAAFIEEAPLISDWARSTSSEHLIVLPFLIGGGLHGAEDVPIMLGLDAENSILNSLNDDTPFVGPLPAQGRSIWLCRALGHEPALADIVLELAAYHEQGNG